MRDFLLMSFTADFACLVTEVQQMQTKDEDDARLVKSVEPKSGWHDSNPAKVTT
jgi:hypothetical protein